MIRSCRAPSLAEPADALPCLSPPQVGILFVRHAVPVSAKPLARRKPLRHAPRRFRVGVEDAVEAVELGLRERKRVSDATNSRASRKRDAAGPSEYDPASRSEKGREAGVPDEHAPHGASEERPERGAAKLRPGSLRSVRRVPRGVEAFSELSGSVELVQVDDPGKPIPRRGSWKFGFASRRRRRGESNRRLRRQALRLFALETRRRFSWRDVGHAQESSTNAAPAKALSSTRPMQPDFEKIPCVRRRQEPERSEGSAEAIAWFFSGRRSEPKASEGAGEKQPPTSDARAPLQRPPSSLFNEDS